MKWYNMDSHKILWHQDKLQDFLDGKRISPVTIDMGIHKSCNIKCVYCYGVKQHKSPKFIPTDALLRLAEDSAATGVRSIAIVGDGEPTMNQGLYPFVHRLKKLGVDSAVATNGLLLNPMETEILTRCCTWLRFNISGVDKYDSIMGSPSGSFAKIEKIIKYAVANKNNCTIGLQAVLIPDGFSEILPLARKAVEWGVDYLVIKQFSDGGEGMPLHFDMDEYEKAEMDLAVAEVLSTNDTKIIVKWKAMEDSKNITKHKKWEFDRCNDLPFLFQISGDGGCYPCGFLFGSKEYCYGNVCEQRLSDILTSEKYWGIIKKIEDTPLEKLCTGQCRHSAGAQFIHQLGKIYKGNLQQSLEEIYGKEKYQKLMDNPPEHLRFI